MIRSGPGNDVTVPTVAGVVAAAGQRGGFLTPSEIDFLAREDRLRQVLVRCGGCRFVCAAQDVVHLAFLIEASGRDHVRDYSLPAEGER